MNIKKVKLVEKTPRINALLEFVELSAGDNTYYIANKIVKQTEITLFTGDEITPTYVVKIILS